MSIATYAGSVKRFVQISAILFRRLLLQLPSRLSWSARSSSRRAVGRYLKTRGPKVAPAAAACRTLELLGPTFVKFGQFLSVRPDLVPADYCAEFRRLQDHVPPFSFDEVQREVRNELGRDLAETFVEFDPVPVAAASVAQVHRARLHSGEEVAIKVQRPGVRHQMEEDILIMLFLAHVLTRCVPPLRRIELVMLVHEFSRWTARELDFRQEASHANQFRYHFTGYPGVTIPQVFLELTTERLLVMEYIHGVNPLTAAPDSIDRKAVAHRLVDSMLKQIFADGFFHGDPHAGNILVLGRDQIAYLDFGIVGYLSERLRQWSFDILYAMSVSDITRVIQSFLELCEVDEAQVDVVAYRRAMHEVLAELRVVSVADVPLTHMMQGSLNTSLEFRLNVPHDFVILSKAISTLEGTCRSIDPTMNIIEYLQPFVQRYVGQTFDLDELLAQIKAGPFDVMRIRRVLGEHGLRVLRLLERPTIRIEATEFRNIVSELEKVSVNVAYGLIIAALVMFGAVGNRDNLSSWLESTLNLTKAPSLSLLSLGVALLLWLRLIWRNRSRGTRRSAIRARQSLEGRFGR